MTDIRRNVINYLYHDMKDRPEPWHDERYARSLEFLVDRELISETTQVFEFGGESPFTQVLKALTGVNQVYRFKQDMDITSFRPVPDGHFDLCLMMEVIEHLHDVPCHNDIEKRAAWTYSGQVNALQMAYELLKPGGHLFITTPNAADYSVMSHARHHEGPRTYDPHVRELTMLELMRLVTGETDFEVVHAGANWVVWNHHGIGNHEVELAMSYCDDEVERGDILHLLARKP
jgi:SAM-dependent methyltransferase